MVVGFGVPGSICIDVDDAAGVGRTDDHPCKMLRSAPRSVVKVLAETEGCAEATRSLADCVGKPEAPLATEDNLDNGNFDAETGESLATGLPELPEDAAAGFPEAEDATAGFPEAEDAAEDGATAPDGTPLEAGAAFPPPFTPTAVHPGT